MAQTSRSQVTITLGRSGQVIKRAAPESDVGFSDSMPAVGTKRSVRDRLGSNVDNSLSHGGLNSKRQRGDGDLVSSLSSNGVDDFRIGKNDLRYKLLEKNVRRAQSDDERGVVDLREKLSRMARPQSSSLDTLQRMPQPKDTSILAQVPPTRHSDNLPQMSYMRTPYTTWTLDHLRLKSPASIQSTSRGLSPPRIAADPSRRPLVRTYDDVRSVSYMNKDYFHSPRPVGAGPLLTNSNLPSGPAKPSAPLLTRPLPSGGSQKSSYGGDEQLSVDGLLHSLGLGKYSILFKAEEVDMAALKQMGENDLKELGIPMGPRKKILLAVLPRSKRQPL